MLMTIKYLDSECQYCNIHTLILKDSDNNVIGSFEGGNITLSNIGEMKELSKGHYEVVIEDNMLNELPKCDGNFLECENAFFCPKAEQCEHENGD